MVLDLNESDFNADASIFEAFLKEADSDIGGEESEIGDKIQSGRKIWIDDIREAPEGFIWIRTVREFIDYCVKNGLDDIELIDTDHDAGDFQKDGGDYIRCFDYLDRCGIPDITVHIHSANPVGANNIRKIISRNSDNGWREIRNTNKESKTEENDERMWVLEDTTPQDITESIHFDFSDDNIAKADVRMIAYSIHVDENDDTGAYNPKNNPDKAVDIIFNYPQNNLKIELFLDTDSGEWDSWVNGNVGKISPEQYSDFFHTRFYRKLRDKLRSTWANTDPTFARLLGAIDRRKYRIDGWNGSGDDSNRVEEDSKFGTGKVDIKRSREKNVAGKQIRSRSGRKYIQPSDFSVKHDENERYYCWPDQRGKGVYKFANWRNWKNIRPLCRMRFAMSNPDHVYGISLSPLPNADENRGFRAYDLTAQPPLQYLTPEETDMLMDLTIVRKFLKNAKKRIEKYLDEPDEDIYRKINNPSKCTLDDIRQTKRAIKNALDAIKNFRADTYIYT